MKKITFSVQIPQDLLEKARNYVYWTPGLSLSALIEESLIEKLKDKDSPARKDKLKRGKRI